MAITRECHRDETPTHEELGRPMVRSHVGLVIELGSTYMGDGDSSFDALVYDPAADDFVRIGYCSTYCSTCDHGRGREIEGLCRAVVDAPAHLIERLASERRVAREQAEAERARAAAERAYHTPSRGAVVEVVAGRTLPRGLRAPVFYAGDGKYGPRVGLELPDGTRAFIAAHNVEVIARPGDPAHRCTLAEES